MEHGWRVGGEQFRLELLAQGSQRPGPSHFGKAVQKSSPSNNPAPPVILHNLHIPEHTGFLTVRLIRNTSVAVVFNQEELSRECAYPFTSQTRS